MAAKKKTEVTPVKTTIAIDEFARAIADGNYESITRQVPFSVEVRCITDVKSQCFDGIDYEPWFFEFALRRCVLARFCNVELDPEKQDEIFDFCFGEGYLTVLNHISVAQYERIYSCAKDAIEHHKDLVVAMIGSPEKAVLENISETIDVLKGMLLAGKELLGNFDNDTIENLIKTFAPEAGAENLKLFKSPE